MTSLMARAERLNVQVVLEVLGGRGSGNFGHAGRPGEIGGSSESMSRGSTLPQRVYRGGISQDESAAFKGFVYVSTDPQSAAQWGAVKAYELTKAQNLVDLGNWNAPGAKALVSDLTKIAQGQMSLEDFEDAAVQLFVQGEPAVVSWLRTHNYTGMRLGKDAALLGRLQDHARMKVLGAPGSGNFGSFRSAQHHSPLSPAIAARLLMLAYLRVQGGMRSGNFGHAGRPGEVGGSAPGDAVTEENVHGPVSMEGALSSQEFADRFSKLGYKTTTVDGVAEKLRAEVNMRPPEVPLPKAAADGVEQALSTLEREQPDLYRELKNNVSFGYVTYDPPSAAVSVTGGGQASIFINGSREATARMDTELSRNFNVSQIAADHLRGDDYAREVYRGIVLHETGHIADAMLGGAMTDMTFDSLLLNVPGAMSAQAMKVIPNFLENHLSPYAAIGGPNEASAEVFAKVLLGKPLPTALSVVGDKIRSMGKKRAA